MNILLVSMIDICSDERRIYHDLIQGLVTEGHRVTVIDDEGKGTIRDSVAGLTVLPLWISITQIKNRYVKGIAALLIEFIILLMIRLELKDKEFDLLLYATPPIMYTHIIHYCKKKYHCRAFLMLKDIFPQNAVDEGLIRKNRIMFRYFRKKEKKLYQLSDEIGCMSRENMNYISSHNSEIPENKIIFFPNSIRLNMRPGDMPKGYHMRIKLGIPEDKVVFVFGGNLGSAQGIEFLVKVMAALGADSKAYFLIVGSGTHENMIKNAAKKQNNLIYLEKLPRAEFEALLLECDVGIVSLGGMYTIPNYPSRMLSYMDAALPVLAITDSVTDIRTLLEIEANCGLWSLAGDIAAAAGNIEKLCDNEQLRIEFGRNARSYCESYFSVEGSITVLEQRVNKEG